MKVLIDGGILFLNDLLEIYAAVVYLVRRDFDAYKINLLCGVKQIENILNEIGFKIDQIMMPKPRLTSFSVVLKTKQRDRA